MISMSYSEDSKKMACFSKASPALKEILKKLQSMEILGDIDHHLYEFGSVHYNIQASASNPSIIYLSISMLSLTPEVMLQHGLPKSTLTEIGRTLLNFAEVVETPKDGYMLTLRLRFNRLPQNTGMHLLILF
ncbi:actin-related protein 2/3 complex subunit 2B-like [Phalaenopsis equestris]|uniref:actin-related protein 2/3 complex subunit 2B-like n=1 Tax=Phalaenopsis equestris TaxID=78828 RepID=UPI0009E18D1D|nr:actin-related protein 2/3 complex subunit 2B-like [Phalaenopsis equestris]